MKKIVLVLTAMVLLFAGCSKEEGGSGNEPNNPQNPTPTESKIQIAEADKTLNFTCDSGERSISFSTSDNWTAALINNRADEWCSVSPTSGNAGFSSIKIAVTANNTPDERSASVQIKSGTATVTIVVTQKQQDALTVTQSRFDIGAAGGDITVVVAANVSVQYSIDSSAALWIHPSQGTRAMTTSQFKFTIDPNTTSEKREGAITVYGNGLSETIMVYQAKGEGSGGDNTDPDDPNDPNNPGGGDEPEQPETPSIVVSTNNVTLTSAAQSFAVEVSHNVDVTYEISASWLKHADTRAMSTNTFIFNATENDDVTDRTATIKFTNYATGTSETVQVTQHGTSAELIVSEKKIDLTSEKQSFTVVVSHNVDVEFAISKDAQSWLTRMETRAMQTDTYTFVAAENDDTTSRTATITFTNKANGLSEMVEITQKGTAPVIVISSKEVELTSEQNSFTVEVAHNVDVEFAISKDAQSWLTRMETRAMQTDTYTFVAEENNDTQSRTATITFTNKANGLSETVEVTQKGAASKDNDGIPDDMELAFPDPNFREYVLDSFDKNNDGKISSDEAALVTTIKVTATSSSAQFLIKSLRGIEYFPYLTTLQCNKNLITDLDVSQNTRLRILTCKYNQLTSLDVSMNTELTELECSGNQLTCLDVSKNTALRQLYCDSNQLTSLDVSKNTELRLLFCDSNQLTSLDISNTVNLSWGLFSFRDNPLELLVVLGRIGLSSVSIETTANTFKLVSDRLGIVGVSSDCKNLQSLDIECPAVTRIVCNDTPLTSLNIGGCTALTELSCYSNRLTTLDVSEFPALTYLNCHSNQLTSLDLSNNTKLKTLSCSNNQLTSLDLSNITALTYLDCSSNQLTSLDVSEFPALTYLDFRSNQLTSLDVSGYTALTTLYCSSNQLTSLNVSGCTALTELNCYPNQLTSLNVSGCTALTTLDCYSNQLTSLNVSGCPALTKLNCNSNQLTDLDISGCTALTTLYCNYNQLIVLDVSKNTALTRLDCDNNPLELFNLGDVSPTKYDFFDFPNFSGTLGTSTKLKVISSKITRLNVSSNNLQSLDVSECPALTRLDCYDNPLELWNLGDVYPSYNPFFDALSNGKLGTSTKLKVVSSKITMLDVSSNNLQSLDISECTALTYLVCHSNQLTNLDLSKNTALATLNCHSNQLTDLDVSKTNLSNSTSPYPLVCGRMETLKTLILKKGWKINGITTNRNPTYIPAQTEIIYVD